MTWGSNFPPSIRSGGHCTAGFSAGSGFLIDVSNLNQVHTRALSMLVRRAHLAWSANARVRDEGPLIEADLRRVSGAEIALPADVVIS